MSNLSDIRPKPVKVMLDRERSLVYDLNAFAALEEEYGDVDKALDAFAKGSIKAVRAILWAGLIHEDETLKPVDVGRMITLQDLASIAQSINEAVALSMPKTGKNAPSPPAK